MIRHSGLSRAVPRRGRLAAVLVVAGLWLALCGAALASPEFSGGSDSFGEPSSRPGPWQSAHPGAHPTTTAPTPAGSRRTAPPTHGASAIPVSAPLRILQSLPPAAPARVGATRATSVLVHAAGQTFRMRGLALDDLRASAVAVNDAALAGLFHLYGATVIWDGGSRQVVVAQDGERVALPEGVQDFKGHDGDDVHLDVPVFRRDGVTWLPVAAMPHLLEGKLQGIAPCQYQFDPLVTGLEVQDMPGGGARLTIASPVAMKWNAFMLKHPSRYVINLPNVVLDLDRYHDVRKRVLHHEGIGDIRFDQFTFQPNVVRVVIPLHDDQELRVLPSSTPRNLVVAIGTTVGQPHAENFNQQRIVDMRVERAAGAVRVVLKGTGPFQYEWHRLKAPDNRFFLDISQAVLAGPRRTEDVSDPYVSTVKLGQYQKEPSPTVRLLLEMEKPADMRVYPSTQAANTLIVEARHRISIEEGRGVGATRMPSTRRVVCIDAGHGGSDPGASNAALGIYEKDVTLDVARRLAKILRTEGWQVVMTRNSDRDVSYPGSSANEELGARVRVAHDFHAALFISLHCNSSADHGASGTSTHWYKAADRILATFLHPRVVSAMGCPSRGMQRNRFYVLRNCRLPAVLIETAFISNMTEGRKLADSEHRQRLAEGIVEGLRTYVARSNGQKTGIVP